MAIDFDTALGVHAKALLLRELRSEVLASNLANADTPNYKARDLDFRVALQLARKNVALRTTDPNHFQSANADGGVAGAQLAYRAAQQPSLDGNTVDVQTEQAEFARNTVQFEASLTFLGSRLKGLLTAIRGD